MYCITYDLLCNNYSFFIFHLVKTLFSYSFFFVHKPKSCPNPNKAYFLFRSFSQSKTKTAKSALCDTWHRGRGRKRHKLITLLFNFQILPKIKNNKNWMGEYEWNLFNNITIIIVKLTY